MSEEKNKKEALRWFGLAMEDFKTAEILSNGGQYPSACFFSQQAAEKAVKSVYFLLDADVWGHSVKKLILELEKINNDFYKKLKPFENDATSLDKLYIPTRYPDALPDLLPKDFFFKEEADTAMKQAAGILEAVKLLINDKK